MNRSHLLLVGCIILGCAVAATAFRIGSSAASVSASSSAGSLNPAAPMLSPRSGHTAILLPNGEVLIAGGMRRNQDFYKSAELYDPATGKFQPTGEMSLGRVGHAAVMLPTGKVLIAGGWVGMGGTDSAELYDPATGKFSAIAKMTTPRGGPSATVLPNGDVLIAGGERRDNESLASAEIFHVKTLSFEPTGSMHQARVSHTATLLPDGRVLIAGGSDSRGWKGNLSSAEIYDPRKGKFLAASPLNDGRFKLPDEAVRLASGKLLVAGGSKEAEIFDPARGTFAVVGGQMSDSWHYMSETKLSDGSVLLAGGYANNDQATPRTWIYRP